MWDTHYNFPSPVPYCRNEKEVQLISSMCQSTNISGSLLWRPLCGHRRKMEKKTQDMVCMHIKFWDRL